jgi:hypothetical protein
MMSTTSSSSIRPPGTRESCAHAEAEGETEGKARVGRWRELFSLREQAVAEGMLLLDWEGIANELRERRGGVGVRDD